MSETEQGGFPIQPAIDRVIQGLGEVEPSKPVAIVAAFPAHFPLLEGSQTTFEQALGGLLSLVLRITQRDEVRLRVQLVPSGLPSMPAGMIMSESQAKSGPWGLISISDREGGFDSGKSALAEGSEPNVLSGLSRSEYQDGERMIKAMGGMLWTEETEPSSTTIWLALPLMDVTRSMPDVSHVSEAIGTQLKNGDVTGSSIFILSDDDSMSAIIADELRQAGYQVTVYPIAADFLRMTRGEKPDLVILDLQAREPDAFELARMLKQDPGSSQIPVLFLTTIPDAEGGYRMDTARYLVRSAGTGAMLATIHSVLSSSISPAERVLVAEPDEALREQMLVHVQARGHPVVEAGSAEEALALVERTRIGVIMANATIAQARDFWLIRQVKSIAPEIRIYVVSASLSEAEGREALKRGASGFGDTGRLPELLDTMDGEATGE